MGCQNGTYGVRKGKTSFKDILYISVAEPDNLFLCQDSILVVSYCIFT